MSDRYLRSLDDPETDMFNLCTPEKQRVFLQYSELCQSPIERIALAAILAASACIVVGPDDKIPPREKWEIIAVPQAKVPPYRVDFALLGEAPMIYALECDGKEFHKDFAADNKRSLILAQSGVIVHRVRGSALYRNPINAVQPLLDMVQGK